MTKEIIILGDDCSRSSLIGQAVRWAEVINDVFELPNKQNGVAHDASRGVQSYYNNIIIVALVCGIYNIHLRPTVFNTHKDNEFHLCKMRRKVYRTNMPKPVYEPGTFA